MSATLGVRGSAAVKSALIEAAADLLGELGPRALSVRMVAERAGVNHGQIHHYFGGKRALLRAAMHRLAEEHGEKMRARARGGPIPPALSLFEDSRYWRATSKVVMDGDLELARVEIDTDHSVPRRALRALQERGGIADDDLRFKARFAAYAATQLGWVVFEDFLLLVTDIPEPQRQALRDEVARLLERQRNAFEAELDEGKRGPALEIA